MSVESTSREVPVGTKSRLKKTMQTQVQETTEEAEVPRGKYRSIKPRTTLPVTASSRSKSPIKKTDRSTKRNKDKDDENEDDEEDKEDDEEDKEEETVKDEDEDSSVVEEVVPKKRTSKSSVVPKRRSKKDDEEEDDKDVEEDPSEAMQVTSEYHILNINYPLVQVVKEMYRVAVLLFLRDRAMFTSEKQNVLILVGDEAISFYDAKDQATFSMDDTDLTSKSKNPYELLIYMPSHEEGKRTKKVSDARLITAVSTLSDELTSTLNQYHDALRLSGALLKKFTTGCSCDFLPNNKGSGVFSLEVDEDTDTFKVIYNTKERGTNKNRKHVFAIIRGYIERNDEPVPIYVSYEERNIAALGYLLEQAMWGKSNEDDIERRKMYKEQVSKILNLINKGQLSCTAIQNAIALCSRETAARTKLVGNTLEAKNALVAQLVKDGYYPKEAAKAISARLPTAAIYRNAKRISNIP